ncbi:MAG: FG-GAP repeat protein [Phycisphaerae bacterium]|nr:FG-GAP repeat protein [Phycisphaerae bacterium]
MFTTRIFAMTGCALTVCLAAAPAQGQCDPQEAGKLIASEAGAGDWFGCAVAMDGDTLVVGASRDDHAGKVDAGSAYVFVRSGATWTEQARLTSWDATDGAQFGCSVALSGNTLVIGASGASAGAVAYCGAACVFVRSAGIWSPQQKLTASDAAAHDEFGVAVALDGDTIVIGARADDAPGAADSGSAYVFERSVSTWTEAAKLTGSNPRTGDRFGSAVAIDSETLVVGAMMQGTDDTGAAYVYGRIGTVWTYQSTLRCPDPAAYDFFGASVAIDRDTIIVTAPGSAGGSAYAYVRGTVGWIPQGTLVPDDATSFGNAVSVRGNVAVVGARADDHAAGNDAGAAFVFTRAGSEWIQQDKVTASDAAAVDRFGTSVALADAETVIGAYMDDHTGLSDAGSVYVVDLNCSFEPGDLDVDGDVDVNDFVILAGCLDGPLGGLSPGCEGADLDGDLGADLADFGVFQGLFASEP